MLHDLSIVLVRTRFPENIGMVARAMANMGATDLVLVNPERWDKEKAAPLATAQGLPILDGARVLPDLASALASCCLAVGATARTGGWRREMLAPERMATIVRRAVREGGKAALVFGSEDCGLTNAEVELCTELVNIPTIEGHSSLNLAQAALLLLYECSKTALSHDAAKGRPQGWTRPARGAESRRATLEEERILFDVLQDTLLQIGHLPENNPGWFMQPMRRFLRKSRLRRHEFDMLMGICRQIRGTITRNTTK